jgi:vancomycin aglycone glucosyltransferase
MKEGTAKQIDQLPEIMRGSDLVLGVGFVLGVHSAADRLIVPYRLVVLYPVLLGAGSEAPLVQRMMFKMGRSVTNMTIKGFINKKRQESGLAPIQDVWEHWMGPEVIVACDPEINKVPGDSLFQNQQTGYMILPSDQVIPEKVAQFLEAGTPPVYIGFGSNPISQPEKYSQIFKEVSERCSQRLIVSKGWANLPEEESNNILYVDEMPFEHLFPRLAAIVSHGGTGTVAYAARAGIPQCLFPFMADQFENRKRIVSMGIGPHCCDFKKLNADNLTAAISACLSNENYRTNAIALSKQLNLTDGLEKTVTLVEETAKRKRE